MFLFIKYNDIQLSEEEIKEFIKDASTNLATAKYIDDEELSFKVKALVEMLNETNHVKIDITERYVTYMLTNKTTIQVYTWNYNFQKN